MYSSCNMYCQWVNCCTRAHLRVNHWPFHGCPSGLGLGSSVPFHPPWWWDWRQYTHFLLDNLPIYLVVQPPHQLSLHHWLKCNNKTLPINRIIHPWLDVLTQRTTLWKPMSPVLIKAGLNLTWRLYNGKFISKSDQTSNWSWLWMNWCSCK